MLNLIESIAVKDGLILNLEWHEHRYHKSYTECFGQEPKLKLLENLDIELPQKGYFKLRIEYSSNEKDFEIQPYDLKDIRTLKAIEDNSIDYHLKYANREVLNTLYKQRGSCDDILIIKNGFVTDTFAGNIIFFDGQQWFTPDSPLLEGTRRAFLLENDYITEKAIRKGDIINFKGFQVINAMRPFVEDSFIGIDSIIL